MKKKLVILSAIAVIIVLMRVSGLSDYVSIDNINILKEKLETLGYIAPLAYILLYIVATLFFLPGTPLTLLGGVLFGPLWGTLYTLVGASFGLAGAFLVARFILRKDIENKFSQNEFFSKIEKGVERDGWRIVMTTRLIPIFPFNAQNYIYGLTKIHFYTYWFYSTLFIIPGTAAYTMSAGAILSGDALSKQNLSYLTIGLICFVFISYIPKLLKKKEVS